MVVTLDIEQAIRNRVSVKEFLDSPVPRQTLERLLDLAVLVPNHRMTQPLAFRVMGDEARRAYAEALAGRKTAKIDDAETAEAVRAKVVRRTTRVPSMVAVLVDRNEDPEIREEDYATAFMALQNLSLVAVAEGLGSHIKTGAVLDEPALRDALEVPENQRLAAILFLGRPAELPAPKPRDPAADRTLWLD